MGNKDLEERPIRCFLAIPVSEEVRASIGNLVGKLRPHLPSARWSPLEQTHITLLFFASLSPSEVASVCKATALVTEAKPSYSLDLRGLGVFPNLKRPTVLWLGVGRGLVETEALYAALAKEIKAKGIEVEERPFRAHLTLARFKSPPSGLSKVLREGQSVEIGPFTVEQLIFYKSELRPSGAIHTVIEAFPLGRGSPKEG